MHQKGTSHGVSILMDLIIFSSFHQPYVLIPLGGGKVPRSYSENGNLFSQFIMSAAILMFTL